MASVHGRYWFLESNHQTLQCFGRLDKPKTSYTNACWRQPKKYRNFPDRELLNKQQHITKGEMMLFLRLAALLFLTAYSYSMGQLSASGLNGFGQLVSALFFLFAPALYFLPTYEAWSRKQPNLTSIALLNLLLGWTVLGWVVAFVWACKPRAQEVVVSEAIHSPDQAPTQSMTAKLRELARLREEGILTDDEFQAQKAKVLAL